MREPHQQIVAYTLSDLHLHYASPSARAAEPDWYAAMARSFSAFNLLRTFQPGPPVLIAGDVFHHWKQPPELITFALDHLPSGAYCVPGQHDLPFHNYADMKRSAYWTLVKCGKIRHVEYGQPLPLGGDAGGLVLHGFPWGFDPSPWGGGQSWPGSLRVAVLHSYIWGKGHCYEGAPREARVSQYAKRLAGFDVAVFGDNHKGFTGKAGGCQVINTGTFLRRHSDEVSYQPCAGVIYADGSVGRLPLHTEDKFTDAEPTPQSEGGDVDVEELVDHLKHLGSTALDFIEALKRTLEARGASQAVRQIVMHCAEAKE